MRKIITKIFWKDFWLYFPYIFSREFYTYKKIDLPDRKLSQFCVVPTFAEYDSWKIQTYIHRMRINRIIQVQKIFRHSFYLNMTFWRSTLHKRLQLRAVWKFQHVESFFYQFWVTQNNSPKFFAQLKFKICNFFSAHE